MTHKLTHRNQKGATLLVSMVILVLLTIIGIAAMSNSGMQSNMAKNFQLQKTDFQLAESAIEEDIFLASQGPATNKLPYDLNKDIIRLVDPSTEGNYLNKNFNQAAVDPDNKLGNSGVTVSSRAVFNWNRESEMCPGGAGTGSCNFYTILSATFLDGVTPGPEHSQNVWIVVPAQH